MILNFNKGGAALPALTADGVSITADGGTINAGVVGGKDTGDGVTKGVQAAALEPNLIAENIKAGVTLFGVEGAFAGGGGASECVSSVILEATADLTPMAALAACLPKCKYKNSVVEITTYGTCLPSSGAYVITSLRFAHSGQTINYGADEYATRNASSNFTQLALSSRSEYVNGFSIDADGTISCRVNGASLFTANGSKTVMMEIPIGYTTGEIDTTLWGAG